MVGKKEVRLKNKIPENFPTDPQAEILIFKKIPMTSKFTFYALDIFC